MQSWKKQKDTPIDNQAIELAKQIQKDCVRTSHGQAAFNVHLAAKLIEGYLQSKDSPQSD
jgi:hypothetical protein